MTTLSWKSTVMWTALSLLILLLTLMVGPAPALAADVTLYEVTEDMYLLDAHGKAVTSLALATRRSAVAQLSGWAKVGSALCPWEILYLTPGAKHCTVNATGADDLALATGKGTVSGTYAVLDQDTNTTDAPEFVLMTGTVAGNADLSLPFAGTAPIGYLTNGVATIDGKAATLSFTGSFRLPFSVGSDGKTAKPKRHHDAYYLADDFTTSIKVRADERSLGWPTVRLEISFQ